MSKLIEDSDFKLTNKLFTRQHGFREYEKELIIQLVYSNDE
jgi:hypothetical protein